MKISESTKRSDYEILIRKNGENNYTAYSPQLYLLIKRETLPDVFADMDNIIIEHIQSFGVENVQQMQPLFSNENNYNKQNESNDEIIFTNDDVNFSDIENINENATNENFDILSDVYDDIFNIEPENIEELSDNILTNMEANFEIETTANSSEIPATNDEKEVIPKKMKRRKFFE